MTEQTLERLMMDAALGGLGPDVEELLGACLDEEKMAELSELRGVVEKAREAVRVECPAVPELRIESRLRRDWWMTWSGRVAAMAACVLVGIGIARLRPLPVRERIVVQEKPVAASAVAVNDARPAAGGELWSAQRVYRNAIEANKNEKPMGGPRRIFQ